MLVPAHDMYTKSRLREKELTAQQHVEAEAARVEGLKQAKAQAESHLRYIGVAIDREAGEGRRNARYLISKGSLPSGMLMYLATEVRRRGYKVNLSTNITDHGDSAAPCVVHSDVLEISW